MRHSGWLLTMSFCLMPLATAQSADPQREIEWAAKRYLHQCINAVAVSFVVRTDDRFATEQNKDCEFYKNFALDSWIKLSKDIASSRVEKGSQWPEGFQVIVTDKLGRQWQGNPLQYPQIPHPQIPPQRKLNPEALKQAKAQAFEVYAQNYLRICVNKLSELLLDTPEAVKSWHGQSCGDTVSGLPIPIAEQKQVSSNVQAQPNTVEKFQVIVTSQSGAVYKWPDNPTPLPVKETTPYKQLSMLGYDAIALLIHTITLLFIVKLPMSKVFNVLGVGALGLSSLILLACWGGYQSGWQNQLEAFTYFVLIVGGYALVTLLLGVLGGLLRKWQQPTETWQESLTFSLGVSVCGASASFGAGLQAHFAHEASSAMPALLLFLVAFVITAALLYWQNKKAPVSLID